MLKKDSKITIKKIMKKYSKNYKKENKQISIKIDKKVDNALVKISTEINISKNKLIEDILFASGLLEEVEENYV